MNTYWIFEDMDGDDIAEFNTIDEAVETAQSYLLNQYCYLPKYLTFIENDENGKCVGASRILVDPTLIEQKPRYKDKIKIKRVSKIKRI